MERPYIYYDFTLSLCSTCLRRVDAKIIFENDQVFMLKRCPEHGTEKSLIATDVDYYRSTRNYVKRSEMPKKFNTRTHYGCPYDCGLCPDHEQHSCLTIIEVTDRCNLSCPTCYAESAPHHGRHRTLEEIEWMLDIVVANEGQPDVVQISGGEPTDQPEALRALLPAIRDRLGHDGLDILLFTGRTESWVTGVGRPVVSNADAVMAEPFVEEQAGVRPLRGSDNQVLITFTELGSDRYGVESQLDDRRRIQVSVDDGELRFVGIPTAEAVAAIATMAERTGLHLRGRSWGH